MIHKTSANSNLPRPMITPLIIVLALVLSLFLFFRSKSTLEPVHRPRLKLYADVKQVVTARKIEVDDDEELIYLGIRPPTPKEPFYQQAKRRNTELVHKKRIRLRFDTIKRDKKGRLLVYAFRNGEFINETLVREGLAYVRLTTQSKRFADRLLVAQREARKKRRGLWKDKAPRPESNYPADPKYGNFHRSWCEEVDKIKPDRRVYLTSRTRAFAAGFAPCVFCKP